MTGAKFFIRAFDAGEELLSVEGDVRQRCRGGGTVVAVGAVVGFVGFAEVVEERLAAADPFIFRISDNCIQMLNRYTFFTAFFLVNEIIELGDVLVTV